MIPTVAVGVSEAGEIFLVNEEQRYHTLTDYIKRWELNIEAMPMIRYVVKMCIKILQEIRVKTGISCVITSANIYFNDKCKKGAK